jgi:hypothetical protein
VKLFLKDFPLKSAIESNSEFFHEHFKKMELDKIFEEYSEIHKLSSSKESTYSRGSKTKPDKNLHSSSIDKFQSNYNPEVFNNKSNNSAKYITTNNKSIETNQWRSYKTLLSKGDMMEGASKLVKNRKDSEMVEKKKTIENEMDSFRDMGISVKKVEKDSLIELSMNNNSHNLMLMQSGTSNKPKEKDYNESKDQLIKVINALESYHEHSKNCDPILSEKLIQIKEIIKKSSNRQLLISRLINDFNSTLEPVQGIEKNEHVDFNANREVEEKEKRESLQSQEHRKVIQNIFLSKGINQQNSSESSGGDVKRNSLSFGVMKKNDSENESSQNIFREKKGVEMKPYNGKGKIK